MADNQSTNIFDLSSDILSDIFQLLPREDIIKLTTVCKLFNDVISNSPKILLKLPIYFNKLSYRKKKWIGSRKRKYSNIVVSTYEFKDRSRIIKSLAANIIKFRFYHWSDKPNNNSGSFNINNLTELLRMMPQLRHLHVSLPRNFKTKPPKNLSKLKLELETLSGRMHPCLIPIFYDCTVKRFNAEFNDSPEFVDFLKRQKELEHLDISKPTDRNLDRFDLYDETPVLNLFRNELLLNVDFKLKTLKLNFDSNDKMENVIKFLLQFRDSLEQLDLHVYSEQILRFLPNLKNLKTLQFIWNDSFEQINNLEIPNIEHIIVNEKLLPSFPFMFPNLKHLTIRKPKDICVLDQFTKLESITITGRVQSKIPRSTAKKLTIINFVGNRNIFPTFFNHGFEEIYVVKRGDVSWVDDFIKDDCASKLKIFSVLTQGSNKFSSKPLHNRILMANTRFNNRFNRFNR